jgi:putative DNA primase/helicase
LDLRGELVSRIKAEFNRLVATPAYTRGQPNQGQNRNQGGNARRRTARRVTNALVANVLQALRSLAKIPAEVTPPAWIGPPRAGPVARPFPPAETLACRNGLLHLPMLPAARPRLYRHTPTYFVSSLNALDYDFDPAAPEPSAWLDFLRQIWPDNLESINALQEWFGHCLLPDTSQQKILMVYGPKRSGKGTIARVLRALVGIDNTAGPTLAGLGTNFGLWPLLDKTVAIISDARLSGRTDAVVVTERLLSISGEDAQTVDRKYLKQITCKLPVRVVILTNELPRLNDASGALVSRLILLRMTESFCGREDPKLTEKLLAELPGILLWAIEGLRRLRERGHFVQPESAKKIIQEMEDLSSPIGAFIRQCCDVGRGHKVPVRDLFAAWKRWCEEMGYRHHGTEQTFGRDLRAALPSLDVRQPWQGEKRVRVYVGIGLRPAAKEEPCVGVFS